MNPPFSVASPPTSTHSTSTTTSTDISTITSSEDGLPPLSYSQSTVSDMSVHTPRRKYPAHLSNGSPPRKTNQKYETMEELLAAAGYSETRVFTPEAEREGKKAEPGGSKLESAEKKGEGIGGMVVGLAGWFSNILPASSPSSPVDGRTEVIEDAGANPFLGSGKYPQTMRSLRTHLMTRALVSHPRVGDHPTLRHVTSAPSLQRSTSARRRAIPSAWREPEVQVVPSSGWSGGFIAKQTEVPLKPRGWFGTQSDPSQIPTIRVGGRASQTSTIRGNQHLTVRTSQPQLRHRARSAPRPSRVHVPAPAPPIRPSPVLHPGVVVCRSVSSLGSGSSSSVQTRSSIRSKSSSRASDPPDNTPRCPVLAPEPASADGLPPTPARPAITRQRSGLLRRARPMLVEDDEPDLASIISAYRPPSAPPSPARRQGSIRSLRALLKDPRFPDVPVVCVASPGTVGAGGPGRALWLRDD